MTTSADDKCLDAARALIATLAQHLQIDASVKLWDGSLQPLGALAASSGASGRPGEQDAHAAKPLAITIRDPGTIASLLRWPTLDRLIRHYAQGDIDLEGGTLLDLGRQLGNDAVRQRLKKVQRLQVARHLLPFLQEKKKEAKHGYVICRCPRPLQLHDQITALPWCCL